MKEMAEQYMRVEGRTTPHVVCDISATILRSGIVLASEDHKFLEPCGFIGSEKILLWDLLMADLPSAGNYELEIANHSGLKSWQLAEPMVNVNLNEQNLADSLILRGFGTLIGAALFATGLLLCVIALLRRIIFRRNVREAFRER
jgi:hypothetical protein